MSLPPVVILAGGLGTRLVEVSNGKPKALVKLAGKPFIDWKIKELEKQGVKKIYFLLGYKAEEISAYLSKFSNSMEIVFYVDSVEKLGTGKALIEAQNIIQEEYFVLTYGDNLLELPIADFTYSLEQGKARMVVTTKVGPADKPNVIVANGEIIEYRRNLSDQTACLDYGYTFFSKASLTHIQNLPTGEMSEIYNFLISNNLLDCFTTDADYTEIGTPATLRLTEGKVLNDSYKIN